MLDVVALAVVVGLLTYKFWKTWRSNSTLPLGPSPLLSLPYVGHGYLLQKDPVVKLLQMKETYGDIFRLDVGNSRTVFLSEYKLIAEAARSDACSGRPYGNMSGLYLIQNRDSTGSRGGVTSTSGKIWQEQRKFMLHNLSDLGMGSKDTMENVVAQEAEYLAKRIKDICNQKMHVHGFFLTAVNNVIWRLVTGKRTKQDDLELVDLTAMISKMFDAFDPGSLLFLLQLHNGNFMRLCQWLGIPNVMERIMPLGAAVEKEINGKEGNASGNMIERLWAEIARNKNNPQSSFHETDGYVHMRGQMFDFLIAGTDTVSTFLEWLVLYMCLHPDVQEKVHKEITDCFGLDGSISLTDEFRLPYTMATMEEISRHCPGAALGVPHMTTDDFPIGGYTLPKGTQVFFFAGAVHMDPKLFREPEVFNPSRFLDDNGHFQRSDQVLTFGLGKRKCVGERLARAESFLFIATLLQKFRFAKVSEEQVLDVAPIPGLAFHPKPFDTIVEMRGA